MAGKHDERGRGTDWNREALVRFADALPDVDRRDFLKSTGVGVGLTWLGGGAAAATSSALNAKTRTTVWTPEMRANARGNIRTYDWASQERNRAVEAADQYLDRFESYDELWGFVTAQNMARAAYLSPELGWENRFYDSWSDVDEPWKMTDGEYVLPTNDFAAYRESGLDDRGMFDPELADDGLLVNEEHPEMGEGWGVDDGYGWQDANDDLGMGEDAWWTPVAYYNHWAVWRPGGVVRMLRAWRKAFLYTGDRKYATAGTILLDRIADVYPEMNVAAYQSPLGGGHYTNITGGRQTGRIIGSHWEPNLVTPIILAYDAFFPGQADNDELVSFLDAKTDEYPGLGEKSSVELIRKNIEDGILREMLPAAKESQLAPGRGQRGAVCRAARVLDEPDGYTREALEWVFKPGREIFTGDVWYDEPENWETTGGNTLAPMVDTEDRDGYFHEEAPLYNEIRMASIEKVADILEGYDGFEGADLYRHPKFRKMLLQNADLVLLDEHTPELGDTHVQREDNYMHSKSMKNGFEVYGDPIFAQVLYYLNGNTAAGIRGDIFSEDPEQLSADVEAAIDDVGVYDPDTTNLAGYGFGVLRDGENYTNVPFGETYSFKNLLASSSVATKDFPEAIQLEANEPGAEWTFSFEVDHDDEYELDMEALRASSYGIYDLYVDEEFVRTVDFYGGNRTNVTVTRELAAGTHTITYRNQGKNEQSSNYKMALYWLDVLNSAARETRDQAAEIGNAKRAFWLYYGRNDNDAGGTSHNHQDALNLGVAAHELELSPDLGYPEDTGGWPKRGNWTSNTISHNTVVVDEERQLPQWVSTPRHFDGSDDLVQLMDVEAPDVYPQTDEYRRTTAMIRVDEENSYAVDFFRVVGGDDHRFSFHGWVGDVSTDGLDLVPQDGGTYAGEDVPKPGYSEDTEYNREVGNGFNYLDDVERASNPTGPVSVDWDVVDHWDVRDDDADVHLRLTMLGEFDEIALADGHPPQREGNPETLRYVLAHRRGSDLTSQFASVVEPYVDDPLVESVTEVEAATDDEDAGPATAVRVDLANGRTDYVVVTRDDETVFTVDGTFRFRGFFGVYAEENGSPVHAYVNDGTLLHRVGDREPLIQRAFGRFTGTVESFTREMRHENRLTVRLDGHMTEFESDVGEYVYVSTDGPSGARDQRANGNGAYPVEDVTWDGDDRVTVNVGDRTFIRGYKDPEQLADGGYHYIVDEGDEVTVPVAESWSSE